MSGKSKARREAKAADRAARGNQRAQAELQRRWHLTLKQQREVGSVYAQAVVSLDAIQAAGRKLDEGSAEVVEPVFYPADLPERLVEAAIRYGTAFSDGREVYEPHCVMQWNEQMRGMDDMGDLDTALTRGDAT